jgi:hypothetical protein
MKKLELRQLIREEVRKMLSEGKNPTIVKIEKGRDTGMSFGAIGAGYIIKLSDGKSVNSDDDDLLDRYTQIRTGGRKTIEQLNKLLTGLEWDYNIS